MSSSAILKTSKLLATRQFRRTFISLRKFPLASIPQNTPTNQFHSKRFSSSSSSKPPNAESPKQSVGQIDINKARIAMVFTCGVGFFFFSNFPKQLFMFRKKSNQ